MACPTCHPKKVKAKKFSFQQGKRYLNEIGSMAICARTGLDAYNMIDLADGNRWYDNCSSLDMLLKVAKSQGWVEVP